MREAEAEAARELDEKISTLDEAAREQRRTRLADMQQRVSGYSAKPPQLGLPGEHRRPSSAPTVVVPGPAHSFGQPINPNLHPSAAGLREKLTADSSTVAVTANESG